MKVLANANHMQVARGFDLVKPFFEKVLPGRGRWRNIGLWL